MKKKMILVMLLLVSIFTITGCGNNGDKLQDYIGDWQYDSGKGNIITYHFNKGGVGYYEQSTQPNTRYDFTWEVKDGALITTRNAINTTFVTSFEINENGELECTSGDMGGPYIKQ